MKKWLVITLISVGVVALGVGIFFLYRGGYLKGFTWQKITIWAASLAGPVKLLFDKLKSNPDVIKHLQELQQHRIDDEKKHREEADKLIKEKEQKIQVLNTQIETANTKLELLAEKQKNIAASVQTQSVDQTKSDIEQYLGK